MNHVLCTVKVCNFLHAHRMDVHRVIKKKLRLKITLNTFVYEKRIYSGKILASDQYFRCDFLYHKHNRFVISKGFVESDP